MIKVIKSNKIILENEIFDGFIVINNDKIEAVSKLKVDADEFYDYTNLYVSPGFIDIHTHGAGGYPFINNTMEDVINGCNFHLKFGTTSILPTISAAPFSVMKEAVINIANAKKSGKCKSNIIGAHLEGPYLSKEQSGAQCPTFLTNPVKEDYMNLINEYGKYISRWTYAPENDENGEFCKFLTDNGIIVSCGHSNAIYQDMQLAFKNGCNLITHLYSCTSTISRLMGFRRLGVIESAFLNDDVYVEIIADGKHLPPELIQLIIKIKGIDKIALITDSLEIAGTDIKSGIMSGTEFILEDGVCKLKDRSAFAGSVATTNRLVRVLINECKVNLIDAIKMITKVPSQILNLHKGVIKEGFDADIIVFDDNIDIKNIFVMGNKIDEN